jgi:hypothetical protein
LKYFELHPGVNVYLDDMHEYVAARVDFPVTKRQVQTGVSNARGAKNLPNLETVVLGQTWRWMGYANGVQPTVDPHKDRQARKDGASGSESAVAASEPVRAGLDKPRTLYALVMVTKQGRMIVEDSDEGKLWEVRELEW